MIKSRLKHAPWLKVEPLIKLFEIYQKAGFELRLVGGCVRDSLLNNKIHDWDLATNALPEESLNICKKAHMHTIPTGLKHGTITVVFEHIHFEITTLRIDEQTDGRHAHVVWTTDWQADAQRRDFTINSLYGDKHGDIYDYTDGLSDLKQHLIRFVGEPSQRVEEDYLRILRYFRFMARFGDFDKIHKPSLNACKQHKDGLRQVSAERIRDELFKIFTAPKRNQAIVMMQEYEIFATINLPLSNNKLTWLDNIEKQLNFPPNPLRCLAYLFPKECDCRIIANQLKLSNKEKYHLVHLHQYLYDGKDASLPYLRRICYDTNIDICKDIYILKFNGDIISDWDIITPAVFPVTGKDLLALGIKADKQMGIILKKLEELYIASDFSLSKTQLLKEVYHDGQSLYTKL
ncbi:MAG: CCA tRNA nucleotidyltransferase [Alphaproteobacteria bacterium]